MRVRTLLVKATKENPGMRVYNNTICIESPHDDADLNTSKYARRCVDMQQQRDAWQCDNRLYSEKAQLSKPLLFKFFLVLNQYQ